MIARCRLRVRTRSIRFLGNRLKPFVSCVEAFGTVSICDDLASRFLLACAAMLAKATCNSSIVIYYANAFEKGFAKRSAIDIRFLEWEDNEAKIWHYKSGENAS